VLSAATAATVLVALCFSATVAAYSGRDARERARVPVFTTADSGSATFLWRDTHDSVGTHDATVITIEPLSPRAPVPPGLAAWPEPGEAVLSPGLVEAGSAEGIASRYGRVVGEIGSDGLASPTELLAYVRPRPGTVVPAAMTPAVRFGAGSVTGFIGESADVEPLWKFLLAIALLLGPPTVLLVVVATRAGQLERQRQALVLEMVGAGARERLFWAWGSVGRPWLLGLAAGGLGLAALLLHDLPLPGRGYTLLSADMRDSAALLTGSVLGAAVLVLALVVLAGGARPAPGTSRPLPGSPRWPLGAAAACVAAAPTATAAQLLVRGTGSVTALLVYAGALLLSLALLPALVGRITVSASRHLRRRARATGDPALLVAAASLRHDARAVVRYAAVLAAAMVLVTQVQGYLAMWSESARESAAVRGALDGGFARIDAPPEAITAWPRVEAALRSDPDLATVLLVTRYDARGRATSTVYGEPAALRAFGIGATERTIDLGAVATPAALALGYSAPAVRAGVVAQAGGDVVALEPEHDAPAVSAVITSATGAPVAIAEIKAKVASVVAPMWRVTYPGDLWYLGALLGQHQAGWADWFGVLGVALLALAVAGAAVDDVRRSAASVAPLAVLVSRPDVYRRLVAWRIGVPLMVSAGVGVLMSAMLRAALTTGTGALPSLVPSVVAMLVGVAGVAVLLWWVTVAAVARSTDRWTGRRRG